MMNNDNDNGNNNGNDNDNNCMKVEDEIRRNGIDEVKALMAEDMDVEAAAVAAFFAIRNIQTGGWNHPSPPKPKRTKTEHDDFKKTAEPKKAALYTHFKGLDENGRMV